MSDQQRAERIGKFPCEGGGGNDLITCTKCGQEWEYARTYGPAEPICPLAHPEPQAATGQVTGEMVARTLCKADGIDPDSPIQGTHCNPAMDGLFPSWTAYKDAAREVLSLFSHAPAVVNSVDSKAPAVPEELVRFVEQLCGVFLAKTETRHVQLPGPHRQHVEWTEDHPVWPNGSAIAATIRAIADAAKNREGDRRG